jgi:hypothetical protein
MDSSGKLTRRDALGLGLGLATLGLAGPGLAASGTPAFELEDQFERKHTQLTVFARTPLVIVGGDQRNTGDRIGEWFARLGDGLALYGIADLDALPFFVPRGSVRSNLRTLSPKLPILCDWKGKVFHPILGFPTKKEVVVQVHEAPLPGETVRVLARVEGPVTPAGIAAVRKAAGVV